uniref:TIR domain-containing protein n=1 Tax=Frankia sp. Cj3 TaxID=2880976 RepID=UPI001EF5E68B
MEDRPDGDPAAFLSYAHADDTYASGQITAFRQQLEGELRAQVGHDLHIFQDRDDITWGQAWKERVDDSLDAATFIIPIVTPRFLASDQCRRELARFLEREQRLGRTDLVLPVYWIEVPDLERRGSRATDDLVAALSARQYADWRELRFTALSDLACRRLIADLARRLRDTLVPPTHIVDPRGRGDVTTVAAAVAAAHPGDRILIRPGVYEGPVVLDKPVELVGEGPPDEITLVAADGSVVTSTAPYGVVRGLTLRVTGPPREPEEAPVVDVHAGRLLITDCDISGSATGVAVHGTAAPQVRRCRIHHTSGPGVWVYDNGAGVFEDN